MKHLLTSIVLALTALTSWSATAAEYDPLRVDAGAAAAHNTVTLDIVDDVRTRTIPIRLYLPATTTAAPVVLFSHGLGGSRDGNAFMGQHWAGRGYGCVFLQHPGSDTGVWKDVPLLQRKSAMQKAASVENFTLRVGDVRAALDQLARWNDEPGHVLHRRLDLGHVGMSGHSFGAGTTQAVGGQAYGPRSLGDPRIDAAIAFSPSSPSDRGGDPKAAFGAVRIPWLLMTGTHDTSLIGGQTPASRLEVFPALPATGQAYEVLLDRAEHSAFTDRALPGDVQVRNPNHHRAILAISTAFWDAWLSRDADARGWLDGDGPRRVLEAADRWQRK